MKQIKINDNLYQIPTSWDDVSINLWRQLIDTQSYYREGMTDSESFDFNLSILSTLTNIPIHVLVELNNDLYKQIMTLVEFYYLDKLKTDIKSSIEVLGVEYRLISFDKLTFGDRVNIDIIRDTDTIESRIGRIMAILYRSENEKLTSESLDEKELIFNEHLSINDIYATSIFFLNLLLIYKKNTEVYLVDQERMKLMKQMNLWNRMKWKIKELMRNIIIVWRINFVEGKFWIWKKHLN